MLGKYGNSDTFHLARPVRACWMVRYCAGDPHWGLTRTGNCRSLDERREQHNRFLVRHMKEKTPNFNLRNPPNRCTYTQAETKPSPYCTTFVGFARKRCTGENTFPQLNLKECMIKHPTQASRITCHPSVWCYQLASQQSHE